MRTLISSLIVILILTVSIPAQQQDKSVVVKSAIDKLFELCKKNDFEKVAEVIAYSGKDESRNLKSAYNYKDIKEAGAVKRISKKIKAFLDISDKYSIDTPKEETKTTGKVISVQIVFISGTQELKTLFAFVDVNGKLLLADLN